MKPENYESTQWFQWAKSVWQLTDVHKLQSYPTNTVLKCHSSIYGAVVLKASDEGLFDYNATYGSESFCKCYAMVPEKDLMLLEAFVPGTPLREEVALDRRIEAFVTVYSKLHAASVSVEESTFPTYLQWVKRIAAYMAENSDDPLLTEQMFRAERLCTFLFNAYGERTLLHGDLHHDNLLLKSNGDYGIIDPKGVVGPRLFDLPRFILNECFYGGETTTLESTLYVVETLASKVSIPVEAVAISLYVETAMALCWCVESACFNPEHRAWLEVAEQLLTYYQIGDAYEKTK